MRTRDRIASAADRLAIASNRVPAELRKRSIGPDESVLDDVFQVGGIHERAYESGDVGLAEPDCGRQGLLVAIARGKEGTGQPIHGPGRYRPRPAEGIRASWELSGPDGRLPGYGLLRHQVIALGHARR